MRYTHFGRTGQLLHVPVPAPAPSQPKPGHWRIAPGAKPKPLRKSTATATVYLPANVQGVATNFRSKQRLPRKHLRALVAAGALPASALPSRGGRK
jgi:hypothetical protein